ncbi:pyridoxal 5'-phosphate synthase [Leifsonia kafniensis]|uniref:Pyridoxal 5'-phosphate synthase n=1 Tax=Leifsonia kafniensis TaxID=475957 RepID=A0ABP7K4M1_9MICO
MTSGSPTGTPDSEETPRDWLRRLPMFPADLPTLEVPALAADPQTLFVAWIREVVAAGQLAARVMTLATSDAERDNAPGARGVLLTDLDERGWQFATHASSPKGRALAAHPFAASTFFWPVLGRQVRLFGTVHQLPADAAARDFRGRSETARASILVGHQSEPLERPEDYSAAFERARTALQSDPTLIDEDWAVYALAPERVEFWQGSTTGPQTRVLYRRVGESWATSRLYP